MPFQSEKQRRYLWANEPEIARDWTDTYGSGIAKALGGRIPFAEGSKKTSIVERNLANKKAELNFWEEQKDTSEKEEKIAQIQADINRLEGDIGTAADTLLGSGEAPTKGIPAKILEFIFGSPAEGSEVLDPDLTQVNKMSMIPDNFIEQMKNLWQGTTADPDFLYSPRGSQGIMDANVFPRVEANVSDPSVMQPHNFEFGNQWQTAEEENESDPSKWIIPALSNYFTSKIHPLLSGARNFLPTNLKDSRFYRPATQGVYGYSPAQLNRMNALGGHYSDPARHHRQMQARTTNMLNRALSGKSYSEKNLQNLGGITVTPTHQKSGPTHTISHGGQNYGAYGNTPAGFARAAETEGTFNRGGLASLWRR